VVPLPAHCGEAYAWVVAAPQPRQNPADEGWEADLIQSIPDEAWGLVRRRALWRLRRRAVFAVVSTPAVVLASFKLVKEEDWSFFPPVVFVLVAVCAVLIGVSTLAADIWGTLRGDPILLSVETLQAGDLTDDVWTQTFERILGLKVIVDVAEARELGHTGPGVRIRELETCREIPVSYRLFSRAPDMGDAVLVCRSKGRAVCRLRDLIQDSGVAPPT
jgi:hypothetical protein